MSDNQTEVEETKVRIINPPNFLKQKAKLMPGSLDEMLANAEKMVAGLKTEFEAGAEMRIKRLSETFRTKWQPQETREQGCRELRDTCHILKGEGGSFGYELVSQIADLFGDYLRETPVASQRPEAVKSYIDTFQLVWSQRIQGTGGEAGRQLIGSLMKLNEKSGVTAG
jgi:hypothetical protein